MFNNILNMQRKGAISGTYMYRQYVGVNRFLAQMNFEIVNLQADGLFYYYDITECLTC